MYALSVLGTQALLDYKREVAAHYSATSFMFESMSMAPTASAASASSNKTGKSLNSAIGDKLNEIDSSRSRRSSNRSSSTPNSNSGEQTACVDPLNDPWGWISNK